VVLLVLAVSLHALARVIERNTGARHG
jgi:hypothetical protein